MNLLRPQPGRKTESVSTSCLRAMRAAGKLWRQFLADEDPAEKERIRRRRIDNIMHNVILMEAMRRWELETGRHEVSKDSPLGGE
jgi:hypothetical protein